MEGLEDHLPFQITRRFHINLPRRKMGIFLEPWKFHPPKKQYHRLPGNQRNSDLMGILGMSQPTTPDLKQRKKRPARWLFRVFLSGMKSLPSLCGDIAIMQYYEDPYINPPVFHVYVFFFFSWLKKSGAGSQKLMYNSACHFDWMGDWGPGHHGPAVIRIFSRFWDDWDARKCKIEFPKWQH